MEPNQPLILYNMASLYSVSGEHTKALGYLAEAIKVDRSYCEMARDDPDFATLREDPTFRELVDPASSTP